MAFLIFDRTGAICLESKEHYPELKIAQASPSVTTFVVEPYSYAIEQTMSRAICSKENHESKEFGENTSRFFEIALRQLEVRVLNRIGLRQLYFKTFPDRDEAANLLRTLKLQHGSSDDNFGVSSPASEIVLRWESAAHGAMMHVASIPGNVVLPVVDVFHGRKGGEKPHESAVVIDVDFYTTAPALRSQWSSGEWIAQSSHVIKKGIRSFLQQCQPH